MSKKNKVKDVQEVDYIQREPEYLPSFHEFKTNIIHGNSLYEESYCEKLFDYFIKQRINKKVRYTIRDGVRYYRTAYETVDLPTAEGFMVKYAISEGMFYNWLKKHKLFEWTYDQCCKRQKELLTLNILDGSYNLKAGVFVAQNYSDMRERFDLENLQNQNFKFELNYNLKTERPDPNIIDAEYQKVDD